MNKIEMCFYVPGSTSIVDTVGPDGRSVCFKHTLSEVQKRYPGTVVMPWKEAFIAMEDAQAKHFKVGVAERTTAERFDYALNVLPPCRWTRTGIGQAFFVSELVCGRIAEWYLNIGDIYWNMYNYTNANVNEMFRACK